MNKNLISNLNETWYIVKSGDEIMRGELDILHKKWISYIFWLRFGLVNAINKYLRLKFVLCVYGIFNPKCLIIEFVIHDHNVMVVNKILLNLQIFLDTAVSL